MDRETVEKDVMSQILDQYGENGKVAGQLAWISDDAARLRLETDPGGIAACGNPELEIGPVSELTAESDWNTGTGPKLKDNAIDTITEKCGDVLRVDYKGDHISLVLWNSDYLFDRKTPVVAGDPEGEVPKLKF
jgi:hypothetical protein